MSRKTKKASRSSSFTAFEAQVRGAEKRKKALGGAEQSSVAQQQQTFVVIRKKRKLLYLQSKQCKKSSGRPPSFCLSQTVTEAPAIHSAISQKYREKQGVFLAFKESPEKIPKMFSFELFTPKTVKRYVCIANFSNI